MKTRSFFAVFLFTVIMIAGCEKDETDSVDNAWKKFEKKNYEGAYNAFAGLLEKNDTDTNAIIGIGWSALRTNRISEAKYAFESFAVNYGYRADVYAALTFIYWKLEFYQPAVNYGDYLLTANPFYSFVHDKSINYKDIALIQTYCYYHMGQYGNCIIKIQFLDPAWTDVPALNDPEIHIKLLAKIETLKSIID